MGNKEDTTKHRFQNAVVVMIENDTKFHLPFLTIGARNILYYHAKIDFKDSSQTRIFIERALSRVDGADFYTFDVVGHFLDRGGNPSKYRTRRFRIEEMSEMEKSSKIDALLCSVLSV